MQQQLWPLFLPAGAFMTNSANTYWCLQVNSEIVAMQRVQTSAGETQLRELLEAHVEYTDSTRAKHILSDWKSNLGKFWQLVPPSEAGTPEVYASEDNLIKHEGSQKEAVDPAPAKF